MSEKRIVVPEEMFKAMVHAENHPGDKWDDDVLWEMLEAALRWLSENPIAPNDEQVDALTNEVPYQDSGNGRIFRAVIDKWQRRMFLAPGPEVPEEVKDLLSSRPNAFIPSSRYNEVIIEAFRRGWEAK